jgi:hypothetical protein
MTMGCQFAKLIGMPKRNRTPSMYAYLGKLIDENRLHELKLPPVVMVAIYQKMIEAGWSETRKDLGGS